MYNKPYTRCLLVAFICMVCTFTYAQTITVQSDLGATSGSTIYGCHDEVTFTTTVTSAAGAFSINQILPTGAVIIDESSVAGITASPYNAITRTKTWTCAGGVTNCTLWVKAIIDCTLRQNITPVDLLETSCTALNFHDQISLNIEIPQIRVTATPYNFYLLGEATTRTFTICNLDGRIYDLDLDYTPEYEIDGNVISLELSTVNGANSTALPGTPLAANFTGTYFSSANGHITSSLLNTVLGHGYIAGGECIMVTESFTTDECTASSATTDYTARIICNHGNPGYETICTESGDNSDAQVQDDYDENNAIDRSPLAVTQVRLLQNNAVAANGVDVCSADPYTIEYTVQNPPLSRPIHADANFKSLQTFTMHFDEQWFMPGFEVWLNSNQLTGTQFSYDPGSKILTVDFNALGNMANTGFTNKYPYQADNSNNEILENQTFTLAIKSLLVDPMSDYLMTCPAMVSNYITGGISDAEKPAITYKTMCGGPYTTSFAAGGFHNNSNSAIYGAATPPDASSAITNALSLCWEKYNGNSSPWTFNDEEQQPFFNCPNPAFMIELKVPQKINLLHSSGHPLTFNALPGGAAQDLTAQIPAVAPAPDADGNIVYMLNVTNARSGCLTGFAALSCNDGSFGTATIIAEVKSICDEMNCPDVMYCIAHSTNELYYHCDNGSCGQTTVTSDPNVGIGTIPITQAEPVIFKRIDDAGDNTGGAVNLDRAYKCDEIEVEVHGKCFTSAGNSTNDIYLLLSYPNLGHKIFTLQSAEYAVGGGSFTAITSSTLLNQPALTGSSPAHYEMKAHIPSAASANAMQNGSDFIIKMVLKVDAALPYLNNGIYNLQNIRAEMRFIEASDGIEHFSCDPYGAHMLVLTHAITKQVKFISSEDPDFPPAVSPCSQRLLVRTRVDGGLPESDEMPNETRPVVIWPDNSNATNTLTLSGFGTTMSFTGAAYRSNTTASFSAISAGDINNLTTTVEIKPAWPVVDKAGEIDLQMLAFFNKETCPSIPVSPTAVFRYWSRGASACSTPAGFFSTSVTAASVTTAAAVFNNSDAVITDLAGALSMPITSSTFTIPFSLIYKGNETGISEAWMYLSQGPNNVVSQTELSEDGGQTYSAWSLGTYKSGIAMPLSQGQASVQHDYILQARVSDCAHNTNLTITTGHTCGNAASVLAQAPPANSNAGFCRVSRYTRIIKPLSSSLILASVGAKNHPGDNCDPFSFTLNLKAATAYVYHPTFTIEALPGLVLQTCTLTLQAGANATPVGQPLVLTFNTPLVSQDITADMQTWLLATTGEEAVPNGNQVHIEITATGDIDHCVTGPLTVKFNAGGKNLCGLDLLNAQQQHTVSFDATPCAQCNPCFFNQATAVPDISGTDCLGGNGAITLNITGGTGPFTYTWSGPGFTGQSGSETMGPLASGSYSATVTYSLTNSNGTYTCTVTGTGNMDVPMNDNCCTGDDITGGSGTYTIDGNNNPVYSSQLTPAQVAWFSNNNATIAINGDFRIDNTFAITNCADITFNRTGKIWIEDGHSLTISNSYLHSCGPFMWKGLRLLGSGSSLQVTGGTISDAVYAVLSEAEGIFNLSGVNFDNNYVGVVLSNTAPNYTGTVTACSFKNTSGNLKGVYAGTRSLAGIHASMVPGWTIGPSTLTGAGNYFKGLNNGIYMQWSDITVNNCVFEDIKNYNVNPWAPTVSTATYPQAGWAIFSLGHPQDNAQARLVVRGSSLPFSEGFNFKNCDGAIYTSATQIVAYNNRMEHCRDGVKTLYNTSRNIAIMNNLMLSVVYGVTLAQNNGSLAYIAGNRIEAANKYNRYLIDNFGYTNSHGISVAQTVPDGMNLIAGNTVWQAQVGVELMNTGLLTSVDGNNINLTDQYNTFFNRYGIAAVNCNQSIISNNTVTGNGAIWLSPGYTGYFEAAGTGAPKSAYWCSGIWLNNSKNFTINCNHTENIGRGLDFMQDCTTGETAIRENYMDNNYINLYLERLGGNNAQIGLNVGNVNYVNRNKFLSNTNPAGYDTYNYTTGTSQVVPTFYYNAANSDVNDQNGSNFIGSKCQQALSSVNASQSQACIDPAYGFLYGGGNPALDAMKALALNEYLEDEEFLTWWDARELYSRLELDSLYRESYSVLQNFYNDNLQQNIGQLSRVQRFLYRVDSTQAQQRRQAQQAMAPAVQAIGAQYQSMAAQVTAALANGDTLAADSLQLLADSIWRDYQHGIDSLLSAQPLTNDSIKRFMYQTADSLRLQYEEIDADLLDPALYTDSAGRAEAVAYSAELKQYYAELWQVLDSLNYDTISPAGFNSLMQADSLLQQFSAANYYEANEALADAWVLRMQLQGPDSFTAETWDSVGHLALQCPLSAGYAVYTARALYQAYDHTVAYSDPELCATAGYYKAEEPVKVKEVNASAYLYYQARAQNAMVVYRFKDNAGGNVQVYDLWGRLIATAQLPAGGNVAFVNLPQLAAGEYLYTITSTNGYSSKGKLIITSW